VTSTQFRLTFQAYLRGGLYQWLNDVLIPNLFYTSNYNGLNTSSYEHGYLVDSYSWRLGPPKIRQLRVQKGIESAMFILLFFVRISTCVFCFLA